MHIPDGYLSPSTCAVMYAAATPFWLVALRRVRKLLHTRLVPLISVLAAFSFVVMMFNLPLPGGTTGHAVGIGLASIVLGPWAAILAVSVALIVQALFFGDGGITTFGANSFNMAIVGALVAYPLYRLLSGKTSITSPRRVSAAAIAGYIGINASALCAAIELGLQPMLFKDAGGAPLYAPYPLSVSIPAMLIGHLTFAGIAEAVVAGGVVAYLQHADPDLLKFTAPGAQADAGIAAVARRGGWSATRPLWIGLSLLMVLSPLGLLAAGTAWSEWSARDFANPAMRAQIERASHGQVPPLRPGSGLLHLSNLWSAPLPGYRAPFLHNATIGYFCCAVIGAGLILAAFLALGKFAGPPVAELEDG